LSEVGWAFRPDRLGRQLSLGESERALWVKAVEENADWPAYPGSRYRLQRPFYRLPGQSDYQKFPGRARRVFARLVVAGMGRWEPEHFAASFRRTDVSWRNFDDRRWPTPLVAFLKGEQWLPIRNGQDGEEAQFARPIDAWHFRDASPYDKGEYARPDYVPLIPLELRRIIDRDAEVFSRLRGFGLNVWNDPADAGTVVRYLGQAVARGEIGETSVASVRKAYEQAWANVVGERLTDPFGEGGEASFLLVDRAGRLEAVKIGQDADGATETVFIRDDAGRLVNALISAGGNAILDIGGANGAAVAGILAARQAAVVRLTSSVQIGVVADGELIDPGAAAGELLVDGELEWLAVLLALVLEFKAGPFRHVTERMRQQAVDVSRRIRLVRASMIAVRMDGHDRPPPSGMRAAVPLPHDDYPTIVFTVDDPVLTWRGLEALAPALAELIGYTDLVDAFRTTIMDLSRTGSTDLVTSPTDEELARALGESETRIREIERSLRGSAAVLRDELRPVIYCLAGPDAADRFSERTAGADSEQALIAALADYRLPREPEALLTLWRDLGSRDAVRTELGISFGDFNRALQAMGESPIHYEEEHRQAFAGFVAEVRERIVGALRLAYWDAFLGQQPLNGYVELRERVSEIAPDPAWLDEWERPDRTLMETRVNGWLRHAGAAPLSAYHDQLPSFDAVRRANRETVAALVRQLLRVVPVWCRKHNLATPEAWTTAEGAQQRIGDMLFAAGALDFEALTDGDIIAWLARIGAWPVGMVPTADPDALGLSEEDLHREQSDAERERARREEERRSIQLGGRRYSAEQSNYIELAKAARAGITGGFLRSPKAQTRLGSPSPPRRHDPSTSGLGRSIRRLETDLQKSAIGLVGEVLALEWLKRNYATASDDSWKSTYRDIVLGGQLGDDSLGYDFEVALKTTTYLFEVKATSGERLEIELGESEVLAARKYSQSDRYRIIFIPNALVPNLRSLHVLPNPFGRLGREFYRIVGSGLRYTFLLTE